MLVMLVVGGPFSECVMFIQKKQRKEKKEKEYKWRHQMRFYNKYSLQPTQQALGRKWLATESKLYYTDQNWATETNYEHFRSSIHLCILLTEG